MDNDDYRRIPPLADDAYTPEDETTRRMSPQESAASSGWTTNAIAAQAAALETRLELTTQAESTLREQLEQEREEARRLREELEAERSKGFWRRLFGG